MERLNKEWVLGNLRETIEHLQTVIAEVERNGSSGSLEAWIEFVYRDLNRAWNGKYMTMQECQQNDEQIRRFPADIDFGG